MDRNGRTLKVAGARDSATLLRDYFHAKDENRPWYMARAFAPDAVLKVALRTQAIAFPPESRGLPAIADTLARRFGQTYDNVYTFYLSRPEAGAVLDEYDCDWLVGMTEKATGDVRVGCGRYEWAFQREPHLVSRLVITIETMLTLPAHTSDTVLEWLTGLPYPWTDAQTVVAAAPAIEALAPVLQWIRRNGPPPMRETA
ncbi:hypothetical protein [Bordetella genomosp. 13]|uniref:SnoaL-like domain-containing protein n=1 Tax=Bordetella genomosp. 13 TaxID=463040 RepID=A0A1W6ZHQ7_9BORD|nr:hypothetical protein [Bordetella genomosp. 13]ARP96886.1 hypothetical protein CAL15_22480 [Bordetella genomosp. 13]